MRKVTTKSSEETKKIAADLMRRIMINKKNGAVVIALQGDLGSGKTTFVQGLARAFGIKENILSPTFVLMKIYEVQLRKPRIFSHTFKHLIHIDCYRLDSPKDLLHLGFRDILKDKDAIVLIEWADMIKNILPEQTIWINFSHTEIPKSRLIKFKF